MDKDDYSISYRLLKDKIVVIQDDIHKKLGIEPNNIPSTVFGMIHNHLLLGHEIFSFYDRQWSNPKLAARIKESEIERTKRENWDRVNEVQKMLFIASMSSFEHIAKEYHNSNPEKLGSIEKRYGRIYLRDIIGKSHAIGIINHENYELWEGLLNLRNILVHNNAISDITLKLKYQNAELILNEGQMMRANLKLFPNLMDWVVEAIEDWIYRIVAYKPPS